MGNPLRAASQSRRVLGPLLKSWYRISVVGAERVPTEGPLLVVANHPGVLDAGVLLGCLPRPVRVVDSDEVLVPILDRALNLTGRIRTSATGPDVVAMRSAVSALREGHSLAMFPEVRRADGTVARIGHEVAYLALRSDAAVLPVAILGTATEGMAADALPKRGTAIHVHVGVPFRVASVADPFRRRSIAATAEGVRQRLCDHVEAVQAEVGVALPGNPMRALARSWPMSQVSGGSSGASVTRTDLYSSGRASTTDETGE